MKKLLTVLSLFLLITCNQAPADGKPAPASPPAVAEVTGDIKPVKWNISPSKTDVKAGETIELIFTADIPKGNHVYSNGYDCPPIPTEIEFEKNAALQVIGKPVPVGDHRVMEDVFGCEIAQFEDKAFFRQKIKLLKATASIKGTISYQICDDNECLPFSQDFNITGIKVSGAAVAEPGNNTPATVNDTAGKAPADTLKPANNETDTASSGMPCEKINMSKPKKAYEGEGAATDENSAGALWAFFIFGFLSGLTAIFTPCVFPMIPMTVTFFTKQDKGGRYKAIMYGVFIILIYTIVGTLVSSIMGPDFANWLSTHWLPNVLFFIIFMIFGASFLGMFDIVLPSGFVNKMDQKSDRGGLSGVFFMAFTMVLVSFSCTGPLASQVLIESLGGNYLKPSIGMFGFSLAFAIPFTLFAIFPQWLSSLPKSGGWLNSVKVVLGFIEIAFALKFLSVADTVYHWGILNRDVYLALWAILAVLTGFYLLGKLKFSHDSELSHISVARLLLSVLFFAFGLWLIPGMFGAPLKELAGYLPPKNTLAFDLSDEKGENKYKAKHSDILHLPHGLSGYFDYCEALEYSKKVNKPVFIDFTGHGCVNCRRMEENVWAKPEVLKRLREDFVMLAMYADERRELPKEEWYTSPHDNKLKNTIAKQNLDLQLRKYNGLSQPQYVIVDADENILSPPREYKENVEEFVEFLEKGKKNYNRLHPVK